MYESIIACRNNLRRRGRYWLRLYDSSEEAVAVVGEVRGNLGPSMTSAAEHVALALVERFDLDPEQLTLIEHYPADSLKHTGDARDTFDLVKLNWLGDRYARPQWTPLTLHDVTCYLSLAVPTGCPFWRSSTRDWYTSTVGARGATVGRVDIEEWHALVNVNFTHVTTERGFLTRADAMCWALDTLANLAAEFDAFPLEMRK